MKKFWQYVLIFFLFFILAFVFTFIPSRFFNFFFKPQLYLYQGLWSSVVKNYFFFIQLLLLIIFLSIFNFTNNKNKKKVIIIYIFCASLLFNLLLFFALTISVLLTYFLYTKIPTIFKRIKFHWLYYFIIWFLITAFIPLLLIILNPQFDLLRIIFSGLFTIRVGSYFYDQYYRKINFDLQDAFIYLLFPTHFFILPSWIVCPFPSDFKLVSNDFKKQEELFSKSIKKIIIGMKYLFLMLLINCLFTFYTGTYIAGYSFSFSINTFSNIPLILIHILKSILTIFYFFFLAEVLIATYGLFNYEVKTPIFNKPFTAQNIFDFWKKFLIQTNQYLFKLFFLPIFTFFQKRIKNIHIVFILTFIVTFFIIDVIVHYETIFFLESIIANTGIIFRWYFTLIGLFIFFYYCRVLIPAKIQQLNKYKFIRVIKTLFMNFFICLLLY